MLDTKLMAALFPYVYKADPDGANKGVYISDTLNTQTKQPAPVKEKSGGEETKDAKTSPNIFSLQASEILRDLRNYEVKCFLDDFNGWHIVLSGGNNSARNHYQRVLEVNCELKAYLILELAKTDADLYERIEERAAIRGADGLPDDLLSAVKCNM